MTTNYYELLQVDRHASDDVIRAAYRALMQQGRLHPDLGGDPAIAAILNEAYATLSDHTERSLYDARTDAAALHLPHVVPEPTAPAQPIAMRVTRDKLARAHECRCPACGARHQLAMRTPAELARHRAVKCAICSTAIPLTPAEPRDRKRYATQLPATLQVSAPRAVITTRIVDLSDRGARLLSFAALTPGHTVRITCAQFDATAIVQWQRRNVVTLKPVYEIGVRFTTFAATAPSALLQTTA